MDVPAVQGPISLHFQPGTYVASMYDGSTPLWSQFIIEVCLKHEDYKVKFMQPCRSAVSFSWPMYDDMLCSRCTCVMLCSDPMNN